MARTKHSLREHQPPNKVTFQSLSFSGPLPPPGAFEHYNSVLPGGAERILIIAEKQVSMAEKQTAHRIEIETFAIKTNSINSILGVIFAFILGALGIVAGTYCILQGHESGAALAGVSLASLVGAFIYGTRSQRKEREGKARSMVR